MKSGILAGAGILISNSLFSNFSIAGTTGSSMPAILGGVRSHKRPWPSWPRWDKNSDELRVLKVLRSGVWSRDKVVEEFETTWARTIGAKRSLAVVNGTNALIIALKQHDIGGGDEVIMPPYTFIATAQAVFSTGAIPVFADIDRDTYQIDPKKIEEKITPRTRAIVPVHICGLPADMVSIMEIARRHNLIVVEDACQAWMAEIANKKVGTFGHAGCFSFQNSKNIPIGEGGAIVSDDEAFIDRCYSYHNFGCIYGTVKGTSGFVGPGTKLRITEYQAAIGLAQLERLELQTDMRNHHATYLKHHLDGIPGIRTYSVYPNVTRLALHLFPFRYDPDQFHGLTRNEFIQALTAEGILCEEGYAPLNKMSFIENTFKSKNFRLMYDAETLNIENYNRNNQCLINDKVCEETVWLPQNVLLGSRDDMNDIINAITKIYDHSAQIKKKFS